MSKFELGYTPANLRRLRTENNLLQQQVADITNTSSWRSVARWEREVDNSDHASMPHSKWIKFLEHIKNEKGY